MQAAMKDPSTVLVNVLDPATYRGDTNNYGRRGSPPGSTKLPVTQIRNRETGELRPVEELRALFEDAGLLDDSKTVVTYGGGGVAAIGVAHALAVTGRGDVAVYDGSMAARAGDPELPLVTGPNPR
ncbi:MULTISPECIES: rhodanese-like domain-containing protein [Nocardiaceae]|uniref:rhodanese-like domain-containing protein n=1 Tax=Nocardiaceae TaxID=85025 RepID=UPI0020CFE839|nr:MULTISPECIES: rhodanese-like domain-containing protein [Rhodococcus]